MLFIVGACMLMEVEEWMFIRNENNKVQERLRGENDEQLRKEERKEDGSKERKEEEVASLAWKIRRKIDFSFSLFLFLFLFNFNFTHRFFFPLFSFLFFFIPSTRQTTLS